MTIKNKFYADRREFYDKGYDYDKAIESTRDKWIEEEKFKDFLQYTLQETKKHTKFVEPFLEILLKKAEKQLFKTYWKAIFSEEMWYIWFLINYWKNKKDKKFTTEDLLSYDREELNENHDKYPAMQDAWPLV